MKRTHLLLAVVACVALPACRTAADPQGPSQPESLASDAAPAADEPEPAPTSSVDDASATSHTCAEGTFVACHDGQACSRKDGAFVTPKTCLDTAAAACDAANCEHGCNLHVTQVGGPKLALCGTNAASTGHMKVCGGLANWTCPENMRCEIPSDAGLDASGKCVPDDDASL